MRVEQVRETRRLLRHGREDDGAVQEGDEHPARGSVSSAVPSGARRVPAEEGESGHADDETEGDEVEAEFGLVGAVVAAGGHLGGRVGEEGKEEEGDEGAEEGEGVEVAELGGGVGGEDLGDCDAEAAELLEG